MNLCIYLVCIKKNIFCVFLKCASVWQIIKIGYGYNILLVLELEFHLFNLIKILIRRFTAEILNFLMISSTINRLLYVKSKALKVGRFFDEQCEQDKVLPMYVHFHFQTRIKPKNVPTASNFV